MELRPGETDLLRLGRGAERASCLHSGQRASLPGLSPSRAELAFWLQKPWRMPERLPQVPGNAAQAFVDLGALVTLSLDTSSFPERGHEKERKLRLGIVSLSRLNGCKVGC